MEGGREEKRYNIVGGVEASWNVVSSKGKERALEGEEGEGGEGRERRGVGLSVSKN